MNVSTQDSRIVIGDGWAALGMVGRLLTKGATVTWVTGTGARALPPLPTLEMANDGATAWKELADGLGFDCGEIQSGSFLREFRNKAFREPAWAKAPTPESRAEVIAETLWSPERAFVSCFEGRFALTLGELEEEIRKELNSERFPNLRRIEGVPVAAFILEEGKVRGISLGSGEEIRAEMVFFADRWSSLAEIHGLPKQLAFARKREPMGILQAVFTHEAPVGAGLLEGFFTTLHKESGEEFERHAWGYFAGNGKRSFWTLCLASSEAEDNHEIAKRLRRLKSALDKMFAGSAWLPEGKLDFMSTVTDEQVRFEEAVVFSGGESLANAVEIPKVEGIWFLTDGYGPSLAMKQVSTLFSSLFGSESDRPDAETKDADLSDAVSS